MAPRVLVLSSGESGGSEGDIVEEENSSSGTSNPNYRGSPSRTATRDLGVERPADPLSLSLLHGDVSAEGVMLILVSPRDEELCQGRLDYRPLLETVVCYGAMEKALETTQGQLEAESRACQELESRMGTLNLHCEQMVVCERRVLEEADRERIATDEAAATAVRQ
nr:uncharacterized protein LOC109191782 [Ipomoea batatas]